MKKIIALIPAAAALVLLSGCGSNDVTRQQAQDAKDDKKIAEAFQYLDYTCKDLAKGAVRLSKDSDPKIIKVYSLHMRTDHRMDVKKPAKGTARQALIYSCNGVATLSNTNRQRVLMKATVDADGALFTAIIPKGGVF